MQRLAFGALASISLSISSPALADERDWDTASSVRRNALVIAALGVPAVQGDWTGAKQAGLSLGTTYVVTGALKHVVQEERPDRSNDDSFPSGHTSSSFAAAATLGKRYGWKYGVPAHAVAVFVGVARVKARKHYVHDVIVGAAIGEAAGWLLTTPKDSSVRWLPWSHSRGAGAQMVVRFYAIMPSNCGSGGYLPAQRWKCCRSAKGATDTFRYGPAYLYRTGLQRLRGTAVEIGNSRLRSLDHGVQAT